MIPEHLLENIKGLVEEFFNKMTLRPDSITAEAASQASADLVILNITMEDPKFLIGQNGQTLADLQRVLRIFLNKKLGAVFLVSVDVNSYRSKKSEYVRRMARSAAQEVLATGTAQLLPPMNSYERRVVHAELSQIPGIATESEGEGENRRVAVKPK